MIVWLSLLACAAPEDSGGEVSPSVTLLAPAPGIVEGEEVAVSALVEGFTLVEVSPAKARLSAGVLVASWDGDEVGASSSPAFSLPMPAPGAHTLTVALRYLDGDPLSPPVEDSVEIEVR